MKTIDEWLSLYGRDHQHPTNKLIHWICVPVIFFTVLGLFWCIPVPAFMGKINFGIVVYLLSLAFYLRLSTPLFIGFLLAGAVCLAFNSALFNYLGRQNVKLLLGIVLPVYTHTSIRLFVL